jgi:hypothetical protein
MTIKALGVTVVLLAPAALAYLAGFIEAAHYVALGAVLALQLSVLARPVATFSILLPMVYASAAITAQSTDAVVALIVAVTAAVGASSSQGLHRGLVALLAAALLGSFEPAAGGDALARAGFLLVGSSYGFLLAVTVLRGLNLQAPSVHARSALGYAMLLALVTLVAWFVARYAGIAHPWWLPLAVVAVSEPLPEGSARRAMVRMVLATTASMTIVLLTGTLHPPLTRALLLASMLFLALSLGNRRPGLLAVLTAPVLMLLSSHVDIHETTLDSLWVAVAACVPVIAVSGLGHWLFWTLRRGPGRVTA